MRASRPTRLFAFLLAGTAAVLVGMHLLAVPFLLERQHVGRVPFPAWAAAQPLPAMYTFAHRVWATDSLVAWDAVEAGALGPPIYVNHYPSRVLTFGNQRARVARQTAPVTYYVESAGRGQTVRTVYRLVPSASGSTVEIHTAETDATEAAP